MIETHDKRFSAGDTFSARIAHYSIYQPGHTHRVPYSTARVCLTLINKPSTALSVLLELQRRSNKRMGLNTAMFRLFGAILPRRREAH